MLKVIVYFYLVFEVSSKSNDIHSHIKASTKGMTKLSPQAFKGTAQLIYLLNKQINDETELLDFIGDDKNVKVDLDYYNTAYDERKDSVIELMHLIQKNYDAKLKFDNKGIDDVRIHVISNPEVLEKYKKKLMGQSNSLSIEDISEDSNYAMKTKLKTKRRNSAFRFDSLSKETNENFNQDDEKSLKDNKDKNFEDSLKEHFIEKIAKIISEDSLNEKVNHDESENQNVGTKRDKNSNLKKDNLHHRLADSLGEFKKDDPRDWQREDENKSDGSTKEMLSTKGLWQMDNFKEKPEKEWVDYDKPKKTPKSDIYHYAIKDKKESDKDDWGKTRKSKINQWDDKESTKKDINTSWEESKKPAKVKTKDDAWSQVRKPKKSEDENQTAKKHLDFDRPDKKIKHKWSIEVADIIKTTKNSNSHSAKINTNINKSDDNSWKKEKKGKKRNNRVKKDDSWDTWTEKKTERKEKINDWGFKKETYNDKPKKAKNKDAGRGSFWRTPIPFVGKKGIYEE